MSDNEHLEWMYNRLIEVHDENPNIDYMLRMNSIIQTQKEGEHWREVVGENSGIKKGILYKWDSLGFTYEPKIENEAQLKLF